MVHCLLSVMTTQAQLLIMIPCRLRYTIQTVTVCPLKACVVCNKTSLLLRFVDATRKGLKTRRADDDYRTSFRGSLDVTTRIVAGMSHFGIQCTRTKVH